MFNRKRVVKQKGTEKIGRNAISFKLPDNNEIGMKFIIKIIPVVSKTKLLGIKGVVESYPDSIYKTILIEELKKEFEKRKIDYIDLSKNDVFDSEK